MLEQQGEFSDGSHNFSYNNSSTCMWQIMLINANTVTVYFTSFDIEAGQDHIKIYDIKSGIYFFKFSTNKKQMVKKVVISKRGY